MKVILENNKEYKVSLLSPQTDNQICLGFIEIPSYDELRLALTPEAMSVIKYYPDDNSENYITYEDYTIFIKSNTVETESGNLDVAMYFRKADATTKRIQEITNIITDLDNQVNPMIDTNKCTVEELKTWQIQLSKKNLDKYLNKYPIQSTCHGGVEKTYAINKDKQTFLAQMILLSQLAMQNNVEFHPSWNTTQEECTSDWTLLELQQLAFEIESVVRPLVKHQQSIEAKIKASETKEEILAVSVDYN
jgi:hypothetical protein